MEQKPEKKAILFRRITGIGAIIIGGLGLVLPILPGILLITAGIALLGNSYIGSKHKK